MLGDKLCRNLIIQVAFFTLHTVLEHCWILALLQHLQVIVTFDHQVVGTAHVVGCAVGNDAHVGRHDKVFPLIFDVKTHALHVMACLKSRDFHIRHPEGNLLENGDMVILDAARDAAALQQLAHHTHRTIDAATASAHCRIQATHVVLMGMGEQYALDHLTRHSVTFQCGKRFIQIEDILLALLAFTLGLGRRFDARINKDATKRRTQIGTVAAAATAQAHETQSLPHPIILRCGDRRLVEHLTMGRVITIDVKGDLQRLAIIGISFIFVSCHIAG